LGISLLSMPAAAATWGGSRSGLPWASGSNSGMDGLESLRGRRLDVRTMFFGIDSWQSLAGSSAAIGRTMAKGGRLAIALGMLPRSHAGQHERCAAGDFDDEIRTVANGIVRRGGHDAIVRLGWEANRVRGYPWAVTGDGSAYVECFRRWVSILRSVPGQAFTIDWNMAQAGTFPYHIDRMYPGNDVVDVIGVQQYDRCPPVTDDTQWERTYWERKSTGSPVGLGPWLEYARSKGKRLSVPEWGVGGPRNVCGTPGFDNPFFIRKMHDFFRTNAASIAYEAYFNGDDGRGSDENGSHRLTPTHHNPRSAAAYRTLWSAGAPNEPPPEEPPPAATLSILNANYYGLSAMCDARGAVAGLCDGRSSCTITVADSLCGDPEPMVVKRFEVVYACRPGEQNWQDVAEGTVLRLRCP
jgi:hypothetical protein